jgi:ABC-type polysaccharide/polyol phosphate export permease
MTAATRIVRPFGELFRFRDLVGALVERELKVRYRHSYLGALWTMLNPLLQMIVYAVVFSTIMRFDVQNYAIFLLVGLLPWIFLSQSVTQSVLSLVVNQGLIKKIRFPKAVFPLSVLASNLVNFAVSFVPLFGLMLYFGVPFRPAALMVPAAMLLVALFAAGLGLLLAGLCVFFRDMVHLTTVFFSVWFFLTPIIYPESAIPPQYAFFLELNPMTYFVACFREPLFAGALPSMGTLGAAAAWAAFTFALGWTVFHAYDAKYIHYL